MIKTILTGLGVIGLFGIGYLLTVIVGMGMIWLFELTFNIPLDVNIWAFGGLIFVISLMFR